MGKTKTTSGTQCVFRLKGPGKKVVVVPARRMGENQADFEAEITQILTPFGTREVSLANVDTGGTITRFKLNDCPEEEDEDGPVDIISYDEEHHYILQFSSRVDKGRFVALKHVSIFPNPPEDDEEDDD
jgi:hypothetical protein